jgi:hypothetical protein
MSSVSVCQTARSWVDVGCFHKRLSGVVYLTCGNHHDGTEKGTANVHQSFWRNKIAIISHPPYSPDLATCDFFLFPKMKLKMKGRRFVTVEKVQTESQSAWHWQKRSPRKRFKNGEDSTLLSWFYCKITLHVSGTFCTHHQEYNEL